MGVLFERMGAGAGQFVPIFPYSSILCLLGADRSIEYSL